MADRRLVLLRHGRTAWNDLGRAQGHTDIELDDLGHAQAAAAGPRLAAVRPSALWTSDLARARQTCGYLERATGLVARADERLREYDVGARQGMTPAEFGEAFPQAYAAWQAGDDMPSVPGAERATDVAARIVPALREAMGSLGVGETGIVVTHGACLKVGLLGLLGWPLAQAASIRGMANCRCASVLLDEDRGRVRLAAYDQAPGDLAGDAVG